ncbi:MAG: T9SS type A sorting domain-containing protein [Flavobacteriales bacterium]|nr:T9SS type A sorting domain-containing protein [Flavobacteriales bacterium]
MKKLLLVTFALVSTVAYSQNECDALNIVDVFIHPVDPSILLIEVENSGEEIFSYPGFKVYVGDVLHGQEEVLFFGIGQSSIHLVNLDVLFVEGQEYDIDLELWTGFYSDQVCDFSYTGTPYDPADCFEGFLSVQYFGAMGMTYHIDVTNNFNQNFLDFEFELSSLEFEYSEAMCFPRGCYTVQVETADGQPSPANVVIAYYYESMQLWGALLESAESSVSQVLDIWDGCLLNIDDLANAELNLYPNPLTTSDQVKIDIPAHQIHSAQVFDLQGRLVIADLANAEWRIPQEGSYVVLIEKNDGVRLATQVIVR